MRLGLQVKPDAVDLIDGAIQQYADGSVGQSYALRADIASPQSVTRHLGIAPFAGNVIELAVTSESAQSSGSLTVNVKIGGSTALSATLSSGTSATASALRGAVGNDVASGDTVEIEFVNSSFVLAGGTKVWVQVLLTNEEIEFSSRVPDYAAAYLTGTTLQPFTGGNPIILDGDGGRHGESISFDFGTGAITLEGGGQYLLMAAIPCESRSVIEVWDLDGGGSLVSGALFRTQDMGREDGDIDGSGPASLMTILEPSTTRDYEFRVGTSLDTAQVGYSGVTNIVAHALIIRIA